MNAISNSYLLIFLPLIASVACQLFSDRFIPFIITVATCLATFLFSLKLFFIVLEQGKIANDFYLAPLSLALEFKIDILGITFITLLLLVKLIVLFYYNVDINQILQLKKRKIFYSVYLLHLFAIIGIITTNNLLNLFLFIEIYSFSFFATLSISKDFDLLKLAFRYFCLNALSSLVILFCFFTIYMIFGETNIDTISSHFILIQERYNWLLSMLIIFFAFAFLTKFFPFWLYFEKIKNSNIIANFLTVDALFIKTVIGIFLIIKFSYLFFGNDALFSDELLNKIFLAFAVTLVFYSAYKLYFQKHLKLIAAYLCLNNIGFILICIVLQSVETTLAAFFYLLNFCLVNLTIFIFATFLQRKFSTSSIDKIWLVRKSSFALVFPIKILVFFVAAFPFTILFYANWYFILEILKQPSHVFLFLSLIISIFSQLNITVKLISAFFAKNINDSEAGFNEDFKKYKFYLICFWSLIGLILSVSFFANYLHNIALNLASYLITG